MNELMDMPIWFLWRKELQENRINKIPFSAKGGATGTNDAYANTWVTYKEARMAATKVDAAGLGFRIPKGYFFLDIDHRDLKDPLAQTLLSRFESYTEYSVSGEGLHIYGKVDLDKIPTCIDSKGNLKIDKRFYMKNSTNGLELYIGGLTNRFAAFTGNAIGSNTLKDCTAAVLTTLDKDMRRTEKKKYSAGRDGDKETFNIIQKLRRQKNGDKFEKLFDAGDFSDYGSHSEADAALCAMIAFRTGGDEKMIDAIFRRSALYRDKWERDDYRESTIDLGIKACNGTFHCSQMQHPEFVKFNEQTGEAYVSVPLLAAHVRENLDYILVRDNGKQGVVKYVYEDGRYVIYADNMLMGIIKKYIADYDEELVKMHQVTSVLQHLLTDLNYIRQDELNANENIINFKNGLLNLTTNELLPHSPEVYSTIQIPCNWTGRPSETPVFDKYMNTLTGGNKETEQLLLEFIGVTLSNVKGWRMKKALFLVGDGNTGKSQLKSLTEKLLGSDNYIGIDLKEIEARFGTGAVYSTRLAGSSDMSFLTVDELKTFKKMTGGDALYAEFKGQQAFTYVFNGLLWFCMNRLPKFGGDDGKWVYDRIMIVNCPNVIPQHKQDKRLLDKMYAEREGIVYKAVMALKKVIANGYRFTEPENVIGARVQYMTENNTVISFFEECMCARPEGKIADAATTGRIYDVYKAWCRDNNNGFHKTAKEFREILSAHLGSPFKELTVHTNKGSFYKAYTLTLEAKEQYKSVYGYDSVSYLV